MKTIFVFNDSCPTELALRFTALGEDGRRIQTVVFDQQTVKHFGFAFGLEHMLPNDLQLGVSDPLRETRAGVLTAYDRVYGVRNWIPLWLASPHASADWRRAMDVYRASAPATPRPDLSFGTAALVRVLAAVVGTPPRSAMPTVH
jgi:hypothetical protein